MQIYRPSVFWLYHDFTSSKAWTNYTENKTSIKSSTLPWMTTRNTQNQIPGVSFPEGKTPETSLPLLPHCLPTPVPKNIFSATQPKAKKEESKPRQQYSPSMENKSTVALPSTAALPNFQPRLPPKAYTLQEAEARAGLAPRRPEHLLSCGVQEIRVSCMLTSWRTCRVYANIKPKGFQIPEQSILTVLCW